VATKTTTIPKSGGLDGLHLLLIRKGVGVGFSLYYIHQEKSRYGDDANEFRPKRWEGSELKNIGNGFIPFHLGPRLSWL
jgi:cytochrome P450